MTVRYEAVNAMLLNEFLKEHRIVEQEQATIAELKYAGARAASCCSNGRRDRKSTAALRGDAG